MKNIILKKIVNLSVILVTAFLIVMVLNVFKYKSFNILTNTIQKRLDNEVSGTFHGMDWKITTSGELILGKDGENQIYTGNVGGLGYPWYSYRENILGVNVVGNVIINNSMNQMFSYFSNATYFNLNLLDTSNVKNMQDLFSGCSSLKEIDLSNFNTSNVIYMNGMFSRCSSLTSLDLSNFDTSNVEFMNSMFENCSNLNKINLDSFDVSKVKRFDYMFDGDTKLEEIKVGAKTNLSKATPYPSSYWSKTKSYDDAVRNIFYIDSAGTWYKLEDSPLCPGTEEAYEAKGLGNNNLWEIHNPENKFKGYCINLNRHSPSGYYCKKEADTASLQNGSLLSSDNFGWEPIGSNMKEALITLIYYDANNSIIWDFTNEYSSQSLETKEWARTHKFSDIPNGDSYKLYIYESLDGNQNLLTIEGALTEPKGGVLLEKLGSDGRLLSGAEFTIFDSSNNPIRTITSQNGKAGLYRTDRTYGLSVGTYTIKETKAPAGYDLISDYYTFKIENDQEIVKVGKKNGTGTEEEMILTNGKNETYKGGGVEVKKTGLNNKELAGAEFTIYNSSNQEVKKIITNTHGIAKTGPRDLPLGNYTIKETKAPLGYKLSTEVKSFKVENDSVYITDITFTDTTKTGSIQLEATKKMSKGDMEEFTFQLLDENNKVLQTKTNNVTNGKILFDAISYNADNLGYVRYKIKEKKGTDSDITYDEHIEEVMVFIEDDLNTNLKVYAEYDEDNAVFTNANGKIKTGNLKITKKINGENTGTLTSFKVNIDCHSNDLNGKYDDITFTKGKAEINLGINESKIANNLEEGLTCSVEEENYEAYEYSNTITNNNVSITRGDTKEIIITNKHTPSKTQVKVTKTWTDNNNLAGKRPAKVNVKLLADGEVIQTKELNTSNNWTYTFTDLNKKKGNKDIVYSVDEENVTGYVKTISGNSTNGFTINNKANFGGFKVTKKTAGENQDTLSTFGITITLSDKTINGTYGDITFENGVSHISLKNNETKTASNLPESITINIVEDDYSEYEYSSNISLNNFKIEKDKTKDTIITNTHTQEKINIKVNKVWNDNNNQDGIRPNKVKVNLYADGTKVDTEEFETNYTFTNLPKKNGNKIIKYTISEENITNYTPTITGNVTSGFTITNKQNEYEKTSVTVTKDWNDLNDQDGVRPDKITVHLFADGKEINSIDITEEMNWTYTFDNLDKNKDGKLINYTITEDEIDYYETVIDEYSITNTHEVIKTRVSVEKIWDDYNDKDKVRPEEVTINLLADGKIIDSKNITKDNLKITFDNLDAYKDGELIKYTVEEELIEEYTSNIEYNQEESSDLKEEVKDINVLITNHHDLRPEAIKSNPLTNSLLKVISVILLIGLSSLLIIKSKTLIRSI